MPGIRLVTDSAADLEPQFLEEHGIAVVPLDVRVGSIGPEVTRDWSFEEFWRQCAKTSELPETSAPSPGAFAAAYEAAASEGADGVVCVTLSSKLSATYQAAVAGAEAVGGSVPVRVIDSLTVTAGEGIVVRAALEAAQAGGDLDAVAGAAAGAVARTKVFGTLDTLDNLRKGGRIGGAQAIVGGLLSIKPVIEVRDGVVEPISRQRTRQRSLEFLAGIVRDAGPIDRLSIAHAAAPDVATFVDLLAKDRDRDSISVGYIGPVIGAHTGPGTVGVAFLTAG